MTLFGHNLELNRKILPVSRDSGTACDAGTLSSVRPGAQAIIRGFAPGLSAQRWAHLQSYGLTPGRMVRVVQHSPVTVVQVEHVELALEEDLARLVEVL